MRTKPNKKIGMNQSGNEKIYKKEVVSKKILKKMQKIKKYLRPADLIVPKRAHYCRHFFRRDHAVSVQVVQVKDNYTGKGGGKEREKREEKKRTRGE